MKTIGVTVPIVIVSMILIAVWGVGMLAVKASSTSTQLSLDLLRQHLKVARIHDRLLLHSKECLSTHLVELSSKGAVPRSLAELEVSSPLPRDSPRRPWPSRVAGTQLPGGEESSSSPSYLEGGLMEARPVLEHLLGQFSEATEKP